MKVGHTFFLVIGGLLENLTKAFHQGFSKLLTADSYAIIWRQTDRKMNYIYYPRSAFSGQ